MGKHIALFAGILLMWVVPTSAESPATQPSSQSVVVDDSTPLKFMHSSGHVLPAGGEPAALAMYSVRDAEEKKVAMVLADYALAVSRTETTIREKWGPKADDAFVHSLDEKTDDDVDQAQIEEHDDHAIVMFKGEEDSPTILIRLQGHWKVDTRESIKQAEKSGTLQSWIDYCNNCIVLLKQVDEKLAKNQYPDIDTLCHETSSTVNRLIGSASPM